MNRGFIAAAMIAASSMQGAMHQSPVAQAGDPLPETRIANSSNEDININIAKIAGRAAFQPPSQAPLSKQELFSILLLMSQRPPGAGARS
ncbi:MAG TPA: hypothetical protein VLT91_10930 [Rhizomicrobium sp.]|nr:hypothetical protein [Rhizomicrobium sp.]